MGGRQKQAKAQERANKIAASTARQQRRTARRERRAARKQANRQRQASSRQNRRLLAAERESAAKLEKLNEEQNVQTEYISDKEEERRKLLARSGRSAYGFSRGSNTGLGGNSSPLG